jgi:hypothetical protein
MQVARGWMLVVGSQDREVVPGHQVLAGMGGLDRKLAECCAVEALGRRAIRGPDRYVSEHDRAELGLSLAPGADDLIENLVAAAYLRALVTGRDLDDSFIAQQVAHTIAAFARDGERTRPSV